MDDAIFSMSSGGMGSKSSKNNEVKFTNQQDKNIKRRDYKCFSFLFLQKMAVIFERDNF